MIEGIDFHVSHVFDGPLSAYGLGECALIYGSFEERSNHFDPADKAFQNVEFYCVNEDEESEQVSINGGSSFPRENLGLLYKFLQSISANRVYIDVTGLSHAVWAPLMKLCLTLKKHLLVIYVEPREYKKSDNPTAGLFYDLSEKTSGIAPIPGFASFPGGDEENYIFVAFLGFEGPRFYHALEQLEPESDTVFPIIGVPGYRAEYPFFSIEGNQLPLKETRYQAWKNIRYASASCPFSAYQTLQEIHSEYPGKRMKIGMFGTKPHALGSMLYRLSNAGSVELIYDHPVRKLKRTSGAMAKHIFDVTDFSSNQLDFKKALSRGRLR